MAFLGDKAGATTSDARGAEQGGAGESARITAARQFVGNFWSGGGSQAGGGSGNVGDFYAMYSMLKGARSFFPPILYFKGTDGVEHFWYNEYRTYILGNRNNATTASNGTITATRGYIAGAKFQTAVGVEVLEQEFVVSPPVAVATADSQFAPQNGTVTLHHNQSYHLDPTLSIVKYEWDFGTLQGSGAAAYYDGKPAGTYSYTTTDPNAIVTFKVGATGFHSSCPK